MQAVLFGHDKVGKWVRIGSIDGLASCSKAVDALKSGDLQLLPPIINDVQITGVRYHIEAENVGDVKLDCTGD